jgi:hypothetical protein
LATSTDIPIDGVEVIAEEVKIVVPGVIVVSLEADALSSIALRAILATEADDRIGKDGSSRGEKVCGVEKLGRSITML